MKFDLGLVSPSGGGKTTLCDYLVEKYDFLAVKSHTTRKKRHVNECEYIFNTMEEFEKLKCENYFFEYEYLFNNYYGTPKKYFENNNSNLIFNVDMKGISKLKGYLNNIYIISILPPSINILKERLYNRDNNHCNQRLDRAKEELKYEPDFFIINDNIEETKKQLDNIINMINYQIKCKTIRNELIK